MDKSMTMLQLFEKFDNVTKNVEELRFAISAMERTKNSDVVTFTSSSDSPIIGETFYIKSPGNYRITTKGLGRGSYTIKASDNLTTIYSGQLKDSEDSESFSLTVGDICYLHASTSEDNTESITLVEVESFYEMVSSHIDEIDTELKSVVARLNSLINSVDESCTNAIESVFSDEELEV